MLMFTRFSFGVISAMLYVCLSIFTKKIHHVLVIKCQALKARGILSGGAQAGDVQPEQYTLESYIGNEQMTSPPGQYPIPNANDQTSQYNFGSLSLEDNKEFLVVTRNSLDLLSSILDSGAEPALVKVKQLCFCDSHHLSVVHLIIYMSHRT